MSDELRLRKWEERADVPLMLAALVFLATYAVPILNPDAPRAVLTVCARAQLLMWAAFVLDYCARLALAEDRRRFVRRNVLDLVVITLPMLRPLRLLRLVTVLNVLNRGAGNSLRGKVAVFVGGGAALVLGVAALATLDAERHNPEANITSFGDSLWWAMTTMTTVGYGDRYPTTATGRVVAAGLMLCGIALLGVVTASLATWLVEKVQAIEDEAQLATRRDVMRLAEEVRELRERLDNAREQ